jgi:hypothetical protein
VLALKGYEAILYNSTLSEEEQVTVLQHFHDHRASRILIISDVNVTTLNLAFATVLIFLVGSYSIVEIDALTGCQDMSGPKHNDRQLVGRLVRRGQTASVHVYRLVLDGTLDVTLSCMSCSNAQVVDGFLGAPPVFREC